MEQIFRFHLRKTVLILSLLLVTVGCDQVTKVIARDSLSETGPHLYLGGLVRLQAAENAGAFMSVGTHWPVFMRLLVFQAGVLGTLLLTVWLLWRRRGTVLSTIGFSLVLAGGLGNLIDRVWKGSVTDFLIVGLGPVTTGIFNVADMAIMLGLLLILWPGSQISRVLKIS